ncbi:MULTISPECIES: LysR family transcriptional regulator [unclassified Pseudoalteromonas]|uniref:LysR family transcriptional regulator n=1 Tax=unclassified Pseudoalteromonas TaxID=194690 RepID=UPI001108F52C|nr:MULTISPECIES: LysR family transcriptional regulator [unclassified Pseudoalteromonas]TMN84508.1 LysR family transcriptional regulator [Pseudoalteromonas sp. S410]TMN91276.1 LysR family transcriptional regulator [Pseudoalteromonas sp. S408]TMN98154.1 LysR family transcriptional regulator [Pseudoalteromonas sp. S407]TMO00041.1 LysR family transcriptional regulator [Pseudoalteromonas sp. S409]TMO11843.1 LysR family transcriptional regulator [Pseudoalteromonas sp. S186]|tara:strand:- start:6414 stop:7301 length:888 start_codon:yes stop_codon:yes gene_type:complete
MSQHAKTEDLEIFITVVDSGSFSAAANLLDQQVAKVSRAVSRLENALQCTLLNRTTRRLELTEEGHTFIKYARDGLNTLQTGEEAIKLLKQSPSGKLRVDAASPFVLHQLVPLIEQFTQQYPQITLDITSHDSIIDLLEHKTDLAIRIGDLKDSNLHARKLGTSELHLVASPEYLKKAPKLSQASDLRHHKLIGFTDSPCLNNWPLNIPLKLSFGVTASSGETIRQLCIANQGIALLSHFMVTDDLKTGRLVTVLPKSIKTPNHREDIQAVYYKNSAVSSRILAFLDFIKPKLKL